MTPAESAKKAWFSAFAGMSGCFSEFRIERDMRGAY
jgi:hypothetical protein